MINLRNYRGNNINDLHEKSTGKAQMSCILLWQETEQRIETYH